jgi:hypothetical protein
MMMATPFFIFILIPLVIGGVFAWHKGGKPGKLGPIFLGIFLFLLFLVFVPYFAFRSTPERTDVTSYSSQRSVLPGWYANLSQEYEADVYPSKTSALRALGRRMAKSIQEIRQFQSAQGHPQKAQLTLVRNEIDRKFLLDAFREGIKEHTGATITYATDTTGLQPGDVYLQLKIQEEERKRAPWNSSQKVSSGRISASAKTTGMSTTIHAQYAEKPWVEDFERFRAREARPRNNQPWILAKSQSTAHKASYAQREAIDDGVRQLRPWVESLMPKYLRRSWFGSSRPNVEQIRNILRAELRGSIYVTDRFEQKFQQNGTSIWWEGMLINSSDRNLDLLAQRCAQGGGRQEWTWARTAGSAAGLLGLVCVVYLFMNLATRGYYVWALRGTVVVVLLIVILVIVRFS